MILISGLSSSRGRLLGRQEKHAHRDAVGRSHSNPLLSRSLVGSNIQRRVFRSLRDSGHTFCTIEKFDAVAEAVAECSFVTSELPVSLSLEMHCCPKQQYRLAAMMVKHMGDALLSVRTRIIACASTLTL